MLCKMFDTINYEGKNYKRITVQKARKISVDENNPRTIFVLPCKANIYSPWVNFFTIEGTLSEYHFNRIVSEIHYYNCNSEMGNYLTFYVIEE